MNRLIAWLVFVGVIIVLFYLSSQPNLLAVPVIKNINQFLISRGFDIMAIVTQIEYSHRLKPLYEVLKDHPNMAEFIVRKTAHVVAFFIVTISIFVLASSYMKRFVPALIFAGVTAFIMAVLDELNQSAVPGRSGQILDVAVDSIGILLALGLLIFMELINWFRHRNNNA